MCSKSLLLLLTMCIDSNNIICPYHTLHWWYWPARAWEPRLCRWTSLLWKVPDAQRWPHLRAQRRRSMRFTGMAAWWWADVHVVSSVCMLTNPPQAQDTHSAVGQLVSTQPQSSPCAPATTGTREGEKERYVFDLWPPKNINEQICVCVCV